MRVFKIESIILTLVSVFIVAFSVLFAYTINNRHATMQVYLLSSLPALFAVALLIYCSTIRIVIDKYSITYVTLFTTKTMTFSDVIKIDSYARSRPTIHGIHGKYETVLYSHVDKMIIRIKLFSRKNVKELAVVLVDKCKTAEIDVQTRMMTQGKMPSIFFKYQ